MYTSQLGQDILVDKYLNEKTNGYFLDIGASYAVTYSNSCFFEKHRNWKGIAVEIDSQYQDDWAKERPNSIFICNDATNLDYQKLLDENNAPKTIDYLSVDIDPAIATLESLYTVFKTNYHFNLITFETDYGGGDHINPTVRDESREFLIKRDYVLITEINDRGKTWFHVDDFWVHKSVINNSFEIPPKVVIDVKNSNIQFL